MSIIQAIKNAGIYRKIKKAKDDYKTRKMVKQNKQKEYERKLKLYQNTKNYKYDIFDYKKIIEERPDEDFEYTAYNGFYGLSYVMKRYTGYKGLLYPIFLHNSNIDLWSFAEFEVSNNSIGIVCADRLADMVEEKTGKTSLAIGPSIMYAQSVLSEEEIEKIKKNLGKTLLILPSHSIEDYSCKSNVNVFTDYVEQIKNRYNFDTILVSLYFYDIIKGADKIYLDKGYKIVSAGHRNSRDFLDVQRTMYEICDGVISQGYTTGLSYGFCLGKPISIFNDSDIIYHKTDDPEKRLIPVNSKETQKFNKLFGEYTDSVTEEQREYAEYLWNMSKKRSKEEMLHIFNLTRDIETTKNKRKKADLIEEIKKLKGQ